MKKKCVCVCLDGARAMTGKNSAVVAQTKEVAPDAKFVHGSIHGQTLAARRMPILKTVLIETVKVVNFIKSRTTNSRLYWILRNDGAASMINFSLIPK
jgi:hypothetical protein